MHADTEKARYDESERPKVARISRDELVAITRGEIDSDRGTELVRDHWYDGIVEDIKKFQTDYPGVSLDAQDSAAARSVRIKMVDGFSVGHTHISGLDLEKQSLIERNADAYFEKFFKSQLLDKSPELVDEINRVVESMDSSFKLDKINPDITAVALRKILQYLPADLKAKVYLRLGELKDIDQDRVEEKLSRNVQEIQAMFEGARPSLIPDSVKARLESVSGDLRIRMRDYGLMMHEESRKKTPSFQLGHFNPLEYTVEATAGYSEDTIKGVLAHEITHALSGLRPKSQAVDTERPEGRSRLEVGLGFQSYSERNQVITGRWLNEAITESINLCIRGRSQAEPGGAYPHERRLLQLILTRGRSEHMQAQSTLGFDESLVSESLITEAYFEDRDPSLPEQDQRPKQKEFSHRITELYTPGFLNRLDSVERFLGVEVAIAILEHPGFDPKNDGIPHIQSKEEAEAFSAQLISSGILAKQPA